MDWSAQSLNNIIEAMRDHADREQRKRQPTFKEGWYKLMVFPYILYILVCAHLHFITVPFSHFLSNI